MGMEISGQTPPAPEKLNDGGKTGETAPQKPGFFNTFKELPDARYRTTESGLKVAVIKEGEGKPLVNGMRVKVNYTGWLESGEQFDSSVEKGKPFQLTLGAGTVIKGWEEGLKGMKVGERRQLVIPAALAYGDRQVGKIPPGSTLTFNVEVVGMEPGSSPNQNGNISLTA
ncbi:MAG: FKBP-type peptidyl-prolyl cis-trans isomerase [Deltaproteobacteria bacterium]|nr:FKBP-type peptidyl-prolyl cis-trans isomerase [Deltaproteobacteria bacterium]